MSSTGSLAMPLTFCPKFRPIPKLFLLALFIVCCGCSPDESTKSTPPKGPVEQLKSLGGQLQTDDEGNVVVAEFYSVSQNPQHFQALKTLTHLRELVVFESSAFQDEALMLLASLPTVESVELIRCPVSDHGLESLTSCEQLSKLQLSHISFDGSALESLAKLPQLRSLKILDNQITTKGLADFGKLSGLNDFTLEVPQVDIADLSGWENLTNLQSLNLRGTPLDDDDLDSVKSLGPRLTHFEFDADHITDLGLVALGEFQKLESLELVRSSITDVGLPSLQNLQSLQSLNLLQCENVTDAGLKHLAALRGLKKLTLNLTGVKGAGLKSLVELKQLEVVQFQKGQVSEKLAEEFVQALPSCKVEFHGADGSVKVIRAK